MKPQCSRGELMMKKFSVSVLVARPPWGRPSRLATPPRWRPPRPGRPPPVVSVVEASVLQPWPVLRQGATGEPVRSLQYLLNAHGAALAVDGIFGPRTNAAVIAFQRSHGLVANGVVGQTTWLKVIVTVRRGSVGSGGARRAGPAQLPQSVRPAQHLAGGGRCLRAQDGRQGAGLSGGPGHRDALLGGRHRRSSHLASAHHRGPVLLNGRSTSAPGSGLLTARRTGVTSDQLNRPGGRGGQRVGGSALVGRAAVPLTYTSAEATTKPYPAGLKGGDNRGQSRCVAGGRTHVHEDDLARAGRGQASLQDGGGGHAFPSQGVDAPHQL